MSLTITVLGAGSWGTALAAHLSRSGQSARLWGRDSATLASIAQDGENTRYLPGITLPDTLTACKNLDSALDSTDGVVVATPCQTFRLMLERLQPVIARSTPVVWACKGFVDRSLLSSIVSAVLPQQPGAVLSGPSFARELAQGLPTAVTIASAEMAVAKQVCQWFHHGSFRAYSSTDLAGVQVAGAIKNVYAIACGISDGLGFGANARAALITRGLSEISRLNIAFGGSSRTLMGLSGAGDLVLTCTDDQSRNRRFGLALGNGASVQDALLSIAQAVEGYHTAREGYQLARQHSVDMPILAEVYKVIYEAKSPHNAVSDLLAREHRSEFDE